MPLLALRASTSDAPDTKRGRAGGADDGGAGGSDDNNSEAGGKKAKRDGGGGSRAPQQHGAAGGRLPLDREACRRSTKLDVVCLLVKQFPKDKFVIFGEFTMELRLLAACMKELGVSHAVYDGHLAQRGGQVGHHRQLHERERARAHLPAALLLLRAQPAGGQPRHHHAAPLQPHQ